jgi:epoxyqueuosine reductase QueG
MEDSGHIRKITVTGSCPEECVDCKNICPTEAINLTDQHHTAAREIAFNLVSCPECGAPVATERMIDYLLKRIGEPLFDIRLCNSCRQKLVVYSSS